MATTGFLLDTNVLIQLLRAKALGKYIGQQFNLRSSLSHCVISVVTVGEMQKLARSFGWGERRVSDMDALLKQVPWIDINDEAILHAYGEIDHYSDDNGRPMGKNDAWIAATASVSRMTLLTTDKDFTGHPVAFCGSTPRRFALRGTLKSFSRRCRRQGMGVPIPKSLFASKEVRAELLPFMESGRATRQTSRLTQL